MLNIRVGTAPDSWGVWQPDDPKQPPWQRYLDEVAEAGYEWIEIGPYGYLPTDPAVLSSELEGRGLQAIASLVGGELHKPEAWPALEKKLLDTGGLLAAIDAKFLALAGGGYLDPDTGRPGAVTTLDESEWGRMIEATHKAATIAREQFELRLVFHPYAYAHVETEEQIGAFLEQTDPDLVGLCLDSGHYGYRGGDSVRLMRLHHARIPHLHLKDFDPAVRDKVEAENIHQNTAVQMGAFCELADGGVDFVALLEVLKDIEYDGWAIVEQDMYPAPFDKPLPIAKRNRAYLREIGYG